MGVVLVLVFEKKNCFLFCFQATAASSFSPSHTKRATPHWYHLALGTGMRQLRAMPHTSGHCNAHTSKSK